MNNRQLTYFMAIVDEGSISKAAESLYVAQPYLSQQLRQLEEELGATLIERTTRSLRVTQAGSKLYYRAEQIIDLSDETVREIKNISEGSGGTLHLGCISSALETIVLNRIYDFHKEYQNIDFDIHQSSTFKILELLKRGIIEVGIISSPANLDGFDCISLMPSSMNAVSCGMLETEGKGNIVSLATLAKEPLLIHRKYVEDIVKAFNEKNLDPRVICRAEDTRPILSLAEAGMGVAVIPKDWTGITSKPDMTSYTVPELKITSGVTVVKLKKHYISPAADKFFQSFRHMG